MRQILSLDSLDPIPALGCKLEAPRSISKERRKLVDNWIFETADHRLVVDLPTLTCKEVTEADCRQIKTKSEYNTFIERQKELVKEAAKPIPTKITRWTEGGTVFLRCELVQSGDE
jgi:hypothetical protein